MSIAWSTLLNQIIMSIRSFHVSQDGGVGGGRGHKHMDEHKNIVYTDVCQGRPHSSAWVKAVLALAHKLLMLMHRLAICLLL